MSAITSGLAAPQPQQPAGLPPERGSVLGEAFNNGLRNAGAGLAALGGTALDAVGANSLARSAYDTSAGLRGAVTTPTINSYHQVNDVDSAVKYAANLVGESAPVLAAGLAGAAATGNPLVGASLATAPFMAGDVAVRQQTDPAIAGLSAGRRLLEAAGTGTVNSVLANAVPIAVGGKLLGRGVGQEASTLGRNVATNVGEAVGGNAAAGALSEKLTQDSLSRLNANRDTSGDTEALKEAAVGGAAIGAPFAAAGVAGSALHGKRAAPRTDGVPLTTEPGTAGAAARGTAPPDAPKPAPSLLDRVRGAFKDKPEDAQLDEAQKIAKNQETVDADALRRAGPDEQGQMLKEADAARTTKVTDWARELFGDKTLSPEAKDKLAAAMGDLSDRANQATVAGVEVARDLGKRAATKASDFLDAATKKYDEVTKGKQLSDVDSPKLHNAIADVVAPALAERFPQLVQNDKALQAVTGGLRKVMVVMQETGRIDGDTAEHLHGWFGADTPSVLASLHSEVLKGASKDATERYYHAVNGLVDEMGSHGKLADKVMAALPEDLQKSATPGQIREMVKHLQEHADGAHTANMPRAQADFVNGQLDTALRTHFGAKTDKLLEAFKKDADAKRAKTQLELDQPDARPTGADGLLEHEEAGVTAQDTAKQYYGGGNDKANPRFVLSEAAHRQQYGNEASQAARLKRDAAAQHPDMNVTTVSARQYAREHGIPEAQLRDMTNGRPDDHVMIEAEGIKREGLTWQDVDAARLDTHKYPDSKSRIDTEAGTVLDAKRVMNMFAPEHKLARDAHDAVNPLYRLRRQFSEAIGALSDHLGEHVEVPDHTVVARRGGRDITWGDLQKSGSVKDGGATDKLYAARETATKAGDTAEVARIDAKLDGEVLRANDPNDELLDGGKKPVAVNNEFNDRAQRDQLAQVASELGKARTAAETELGKGGALRDGQGKLRTLSNKERALVKAHDALADKYNHLADKVGRDRPSEFEADKAHRMLDQEPLDRNIHAAAAEYGDALGGRFKASEHQDAEGNPLHADNFEQRNNLDGSLRKSTLDAIDSKINRLENLKTSDGSKVNVIAQRVGAKARELFANRDKLRLVDQALLASIVKDEKISSISETVNDLHHRYQAKLETQAPAQEPTNLRNKQALQKIAAALNAEGKSITSSELMLRYGRLVAQRADASPAVVLREFARSLNVPVKKLDGLPDLYRAQRLEGPAKKPSAFVERVLGEGDLAPVTQAIKDSTDALAVRRAVDALADHLDNPRAQEVLAAANARMGELVQEPGVAYNLQRTNPAHASSANAKADVHDYIRRVLGKSVDVEFAQMLHAGEFVRDAARVPQGLAEDAIRISVHALDPLGTAYHEALHAFVAKLADAGLDAAPLFQAADSPHVQARLRELLQNDPDALKQIATSREERAAYMYQFWEAGQLELTGKPKSVLGIMADFFRKVLGMWTNDERAEHIMNYFGSGEFAKDFGDRSAVARVLNEGTVSQDHYARQLAKFKEFVGPLDTLATRVISTGDAQVRGFKNAALDSLLDKVYSPLQGAHDDAGYLPVARAKRTQVLNGLADDLGGYGAAHVTDALAAMQRGERGATPEERHIILRVRKTLDGMYDYMTAAGVKMNDLGYGKDYFPRAWDTNKVLAAEPAFRAMLQRYKDAGQFDGSIDQVVAALTRSDGSELQVETAKPGAQFTRERVLGFITGRDAQPFLNTNLYQTLNSYVTQGARRAEWARRFGDDGAKLKDIFVDARKQGATEDQIQTAMKYLKGVDGTLGDAIDPKLRRAFGNMIVYQNIRILPLMLFSSLIDSGGIMVRGGTVGEAFKTFKRGFAEIPEGFKQAGNRQRDEWTRLAETVGTIDSAVLMHTLGSSYSQGMTSDVGRRVNDTLFKYNLAEQYNVSMRVGATEAAVNFLGRHADGTGSIHSARWLAELGFKPGEIALDKAGRPLITFDDFKQANKQISDAEAQAKADKIGIAVNKWVDGAILRPNAAHKPIWMNDPHFALIAHLKQFVYSFQETILKRVANEVRHGNLGPAYALAAYVPFMLAADLAKGALLNGGNQPANRQNWDAADYLWYETQRAGLYGVGQFGIDVAKGIHRGGTGVGALSGPTIEQLGEAVSTVAGPEQFKTFAVNSLPANQLYAAVEAANTSAVD